MITRFFIVLYILTAVFAVFIFSQLSIAPAEYAYFHILYNFENPSDRRRIEVRTKKGIYEFPDRTPKDVMDAVLRKEFPKKDPAQHPSTAEDGKFHRVFRKDAPCATGDTCWKIRIKEAESFSLFNLTEVFFGLIPFLGVFALHFIIGLPRLG